MTPTSYPVLICLCLLVAGCELFQNSAEPVVDIPSEFVLEPFEEITESGREFQIRLRTVADFECSNYSVDVILNHEPRTYELELRKLVVPELCAPGEEPARAEASAPTPVIGQTDFRVILRNLIESEGRLNFSQEAYRFEFETQNGFEFSEKELLRLPQRAVWGSVQHAEEQVRTDFWNEVATLDHELPPPGYYGYFRATGDAQNFGESTGAKSAAIYLNDPLDDLRQLIEDYRATYGTAIQISLRTGTGELL